MADQFAGAAAGAGCAELQKHIINTIKTAAQFKSTLKRIADTIKRIMPNILAIEKSNQASAQYVKLLTRGNDLIYICSKVKSWQVVHRYFYGRDLKKFEAELLEICQVDMQVHQLAISAQNSATLGDGTELCAAPDPPEYVIGLDLPLEELKAMFLVNSEGSTLSLEDARSLSPEDPKVVVLSAMPGCGKTTLAQMICHDKAIRDIYKHIFFVPVSKMGNIKVIVQKIYQHKHCQLPHIVDDNNAILHLRTLFKQLGTAPILLVLDDVWSPELLESLVRKFKIEGIPQYKILVTTRFEHPKLKPVTYKLDSLKFEDAKKLFCHSADWTKSGTGDSGVSEDLVNKIVKGCKGFPLALDIVGHSLEGQPHWIWEDLLIKWSSGQSNVIDECSVLLSLLTTSLDALDETKTLASAKQCFFDLGSFPEDQRIPAATLLDMWVELYGFDEGGSSTLSNLSRLANRNFVHFGTKRKDEKDLGGYCNEKFVTLHDMLRELAIFRCSQEPIEQRKRLIMEINNDELQFDHIKEPLLNAQLVSISTDDSFTSNRFNMEFPMAKVLILNFHSKDYSLSKFVKGMEQLRVLIITNYGFAAAEIIDLQLIEHISSLRRIRLEHISLSPLGSCALQLSELKKISLIMCEIGDALNNCAQLFPNLEEVEIDCCPNLVQLPVALCKLISLKKLSITSCNKLYEVPAQIGKLESLEVLRLNSCTNLKELPESIGDLRKLNFLDISDCLNIKRMPRRFGELLGLNTLQMRGCHGNVKIIAKVKEDPSLDWLPKMFSS